MSENYEALRENYEALREHNDLAREWLGEARRYVALAAARYCATGDREACADLRAASARERQIWLSWLSSGDEREAAFRRAYPAAAAGGA